MQAAAKIGPAAARGSWILVLAGLLVSAGSIHLVLTPEHIEEGPHFGLFFLASRVGD